MTTVTATFTKDETPVDPVDPTEPTQPAQPTQRSASTASTSSTANSIATPSKDNTTNKLLTIRKLERVAAAKTETKNQK